MALGKRVRVIGRLEYQTWNDKATGEPRSRAVIVASQVLFLDYDRARPSLAEAPEAEKLAIEDAAPAAELPVKPKRRQPTQAA
jgi:single-stranded DNA-binding protein